MRYDIHPYCTFKTPEVQERTKFVCDLLTEVIYAMASYCQERKLPFRITDSVSTPEEDRKLSRVSDEHSTARAFDFSIRGWSESDISDFVEHFELQFKNVSAVSLATHQARLIVRHDNGNGDHVHVQLARKFAIQNPLKLDAAPSEA